MMKTFKLDTLSLAITSALGLTGVAHAQVAINDTLTGTSSSYNWKALNGACLTAGTSFTISSTNSIPACRVGTTNFSYYSGKTLVGGATGALPDANKSGALRLTNGDTGGGSNGDQQTGAIVSNFTFPTYSGLQVTWTSVTYGGDGYPNNLGAASGADGLSFFLSDGSQPATVGASGGSLGYSCSNQSGNATWDGVQGGYLGIGIDEFGNFSSKSDNTSSGNTVTGQTPGQIVVRGSGNTTFAWLNANYPAYYPSTLATSDRHAAVNKTCSTGVIYDYSTPSAPKKIGTALPHNYDYLKGSAVAVLATDPPIYSQEAAGTGTGGVSNAVRGKATPITYALTITQGGLLTFSYAINGGSTNTVLTDYPLVTNVGPMPSSFRFGFSSGTGGGSNIHEITCFKAAPANSSGGSAGSNVQSGIVQTDSQLYLAYSNPVNSWGSLTAQNLVFTAASGSTPSTLTVSSTVNWDAGCVLTGGSCPAQISSSGTVPTVTALTDNTTRRILSWSGSAGVPFEWSNASWQAALGSSDEVDYLRGLRTKEVSNSGGIYRVRTSLLGDIVDSSPVWVGPPNFGYSTAWNDTLYPASAAPEGSSYADFKTQYAGRLNVVYVGSNDGMLHGFQAGSYINGVLDQTTNNGKELLAYVPNQVAQVIKSSNPKLDFSNTSYSHNFFVDGAPTQGDLYYGGAWHTWVAGGLGPGGQAGGPIADNTTPETGTVYALEVTDPSKFSEASAASIVKAELSSTSLNSSNACTGIASGCGDNLGASYGIPLIRRLHDGTWGLIFGNGLNSKTGTAGVFIAHVSAVDGSISSVQFLDTGKKGPSSTSNGVTTTVLNGIVQPTPADLDGDHIVDYIYAGDLLGNVWRFDLTDSNAMNWTVKSTPLFTTQSGQPITSGLAIDAVTTVSDKGAAAAQPRIIVAFGTGQKLPQTLSSSTSYPTTPQSIYGFWDADMANWNGNSKVQAQYQYASLTPSTSVPAIVPGTGGTGNLLVHTITTASGARTTDTKQYVCWAGSTSCAGVTNNQMGWELDLTVKPASGGKPAVAEQVLFNPLVVSHYFNTNTDIPTLAQALTCDTSSEQAFSIGISMATGDASAGIPGPSSTYTYFTGTPVGTIGVATQATGTSSAVTAPDGSQWLAFQKNDGTGGTLGISPLPLTGPGKGARQTWTKMR